MRLRRAVSRHRPVVVQALRMTASSLAAFGLASAFGLPQGFWAVITALIVTQANVGGSLKAAFDRFAGSVCGAVYGGAVAFAFPTTASDGARGALVVAVGPLSVLAASSAGFRVAPITAIIVLLGTAGATLGPVGFALDRVLEVGLGCAVGLLASVLVVPARASRSLLNAAARITRLLARQLEVLALPDGHAPPDLGPSSRPPARAWPSWRASWGKRRGSGGAAWRKGPIPPLCSRTLLRLRHDVVMLRRTAGGAWHETVRARARRALGGCGPGGRRPTRDLAGRWPKGLRQGGPTPGRSHRQLQGGARRVRRQGVTRSLPMDEVGRLFGVGFALDQLAATWTT